MTAPAALLPYQQAWIADHAQVKICEKSRRIGLSWAEASDDALTAASEQSAGGDDVWYIGYNREMAEEFIRDVAFWARHYQLAASEIGEEVIKDEDRDILTFVIRFASGFRVTALSSRPSNLRGKAGIVVIDEAAFHDDLDGLIKAAMALLMWGGKVRIISTHNGELNAFNELILDVRAGKKPYSLHRIELRQAIGQGLYQRICLATGKTWTQAAEDAWVAQMYAFYGDHAAEELDVIPSAGSGTYLTRAMIEAVMKPDIPVIRYAQNDAFALLPAHIREAEVRDWCETHLAPVIAAMPQNLDTYMGGDFGRSGDLSVNWPLMQTPALVLETPFVVELRNVPFEQQRQISFFVCDRLPRFRAGAFDGRGNGQYLAEVMMQRYGAGRIEAVMLSTEWYRNNMPRVKAAVEDKTFTMPRNADTLADWRSLKMDKGVAKVPEKARTRGSDGGDRHGDSAIAGSLAIYAATTMEPAPIEYQAVGRPRAGHLIDQAFAGGRLPPIRDTGFGVVAGGNDFGGF